MEVLRGGEHFLKTHAPLLMAELKDVGETNRDIFGELENYVTDLGYQLYKIRKHSIQRCKKASLTQLKGISSLSKSVLVPFLKFYRG